MQDPNDPLFPNGPLIEKAGRVFAFQAPLDDPANQVNAWGSFVLLEPRDTTPERLLPPFSALTGAEIGPSPRALFGAWIVSGNYIDGTDGDEFVISARQRAVPWPTPTSPPVGRAGQVYGFRISD